MSSAELTKFNFEITNLEQAMQYAKLFSESDLAPKDYKGKAGNVLVAIQMGYEIGLKPLQALQNIAVINGKPTLYGDAMIGLIQDHPLCEYVKEEIKGDTAFCTVKRRGEQEYTYSFSKEEAKQAGLLGKTGPWSQYPKRMLQMRARAFALRDKFSDVLKGIAMREEVMDYQKDYAVIQQEQTNDLNASLGLIEKKEARSEEVKQNYDMSKLCREISECSSMEELETSFKRNYKIAKINQNHLSILTEIKDKRKIELEKAHDQFLKELDGESIDSNGEIKGT